MNLGPLEILVVLVVALLVFGPKRLPEVGKQVGAALREIRKVQDTVRSEVNAVIQASPAPRAAKPARLSQSQAEPDTADPDSAGPDSAEPDTAEPDTAGPDTAEPDSAARPERVPDPPLSERSGPEPGFEASPGSFS